MALQPFSLDDAYGSVPVAKKPDTGITERPDILKDFESLRDTHGASITSLARTPKHNADVGGKVNSQHLKGTAGDFVVPKENRAAFKADAIARGYQPIDEGTHIHLQLPRGSKQPVTGSTDGGPKQQVGGAFSLDDAYGADTPVAKPAPVTDPSDAPDGLGTNLLLAAEDTLAPIAKAAKGTFKYIQDRLKTESGDMPIDSMDYKPTQGMPDPYAEFRRITRAKDAAKHATPELEGDHFGIAPLFENIMDNSLPAHLVKGFNTIPEAKQLAVLNARKVLQQEEIVKHPDKYPAISVQAAKDAIAARTKKQGKGVGQYWTALKQAAEEHPKKFAGGLFNALTADPEMVMIPGGTGFKAIEGTAKAVRGVEITSKILKTIDHAVDAGLTGAGMNTGITAGAMFADGKGYDKVELQGAATLGLALGGTLGAVFHDGAVAKTKDLDAAKLNGTYEQILRDRAKYDVEVEAAARQEFDPRVTTEAQAKINEMLGITSKTDREAFLQQRRKDVKSAFKTDAEYADYQQFKAEERVQRAEQIAKETGARDAHTAAQSAQAAADTTAKIPSAEPPSGYSPGEVLRVLKKPAFQRTAEDLVVLRSLKNGGKGQRGSASPEDIRKVAAIAGVGTVAATAGAAMFPKDRKLGAVAGVMLAGLGAFAHGSEGFRGGRSLISQEGAFKGLGGNFTDGVKDDLGLSIDYERPAARDMISRYLNRHAGQATDPLKDMILPDGERWEDVMDASFDKRPVRDWKRTGRANGPDDEFQYGFDNSRTSATAQAKILNWTAHVGDYLRTLPKDVAEKYDFVRASKETVAWDKANAKKMKEARAKKFEGPVYKEYPDGYKWVQLTKPGEFAQESDVMGHSVRGYEPWKRQHSGPGVDHFDWDTPHPDWVPASGDSGHPDYGHGGWEGIKSGTAKVYSLRDPEGMSHVTVEVGHAKNEQIYADGTKGEPYDIVTQIKGKQNAKPNEKYIPYVQDFVKSGKWAGVDDLHNTDLITTKSGYRTKDIFKRYEEDVAEYHPNVQEAKAEYLKQKDIADQKRASLHRLQDKVMSGISQTDDLLRIELKRKLPKIEEDVANALRDYKELREDITLGATDIPDSIEDIAKIPKGQFPRNQRGEADPRLLARASIIGLGAAAGYALSPKDHKMAGALFGGLAGLLVPGGGTVLDRMRQSGAISPEGDIISMLVKRGDLVEPKDAAKIQAEDIKLVEMSKAGDQQAFAKLHKQYYPRLKRAADKFVRDAGPKLGIDGDDIATDTFVKIWQKLDTYNGESQFYTWAHSIMRNEGLQAIRKAANQREGGNVRISSMHTSGTDAGPGSLASGHIVDTESGAIKGSVEEAAADVTDTPENAAIRSQVEQQVIKAFKKLPELQRKVLTLSEVELMGSKEIAEQLGIPVKTVDSYISRGRAKVMEDLRNDYSPRSPGGHQAGAADSRVLKAAAIAGLGALAGGSLNTKHRVWGAILGAGLFTVLGRGKNVWKDADHVAGIMSTRILNKSEAVHFRLKSYYKVRAQVTHDLIAAGDPFLTRVNKLKKSTSKLIEHSILTGDAKVTDRLLNAVGDADLIAGWNVMRTTLKGIGKQLFDLGMIKELNENYFPRMVKDKEGLFKAIGKDQAQKITDLIEKANKESLKKTGSPLTEIQESDIINKIIGKQGVKGLSGREGYTHARRFEEIPEELMPFYANLAESYHTYVRTAVKNIELAKFFGKHLVMKEEAGIKFTDIERSIGNYVNADIKNGKLDSNDVTQIHEMIKAMLGSEKGGNKTLQGAKNVLLGSYLGNPLAAATQITSPFIAAHLQGIRPALEAVVRNLTRTKIISHKTFGLADHMSEEFVGTTRSAKFLKFVMAKGLFKFGDLFDKDVKLNAAVIKARSMATRETGRAKLAEKFKGQFGPERFEKLLTELKTKKVGPETEMLAYLELSRSDPIDAAEMSEFYAANPNGRSLLMLKSYMLKELDIVRRDSYNHIKKGGVSNIAKGVAGLASASIAFSLSGMSAKHLKDWMLGRPFHFDNSEIVMNMVKTFGWSQYASDKSFGTTTKSGKPSSAKSQFFTQIGEMVAPPVPYKQLDQIWNLDPKGVATIPIVGRFLAEHYANNEAKAKAAKAAEVGDD